MKLPRHDDASMENEEDKLRWMIQRYENLIELRYYLVFLLVADGRYGPALSECKKVLGLDPANRIALAWQHILAERLRLQKQVTVSLSGGKRPVQRSWAGIGCSRSQCLLIT